MCLLRALAQSVCKRQLHTQIVGLHSGTNVPSPMLWSVGRVGKRLEEVMDHRTCFGRVSQVVSCKWHEPMLGPKESSNDCKANPKLNSADIHPKQKHDRTICASKRVHPKPSYAKTNVSSRRNAHFRKSTLHHSAA